MTIVFETPTVIDPVAIVTFGVNAKENDGAIGYFGTGLKYSIAVLMRFGIDISIQSGDNLYQFAKEDLQVRGKEFSIITMNGERLGFTTELGKDWRIWMAYRELYCNTIDEYGAIYSIEDDYPHSDPVITRVFVDGELFNQAHLNRHEFIIEPHERAVVKSTNGIEFYPGPTNCLFYRKIKVHEDQKPFIYKYNFEKKVDLTEDRTLKNPSFKIMDVFYAIVQHDNKDFIRSILQSSTEFFEASYDFLTWVTIPPSVEFSEVANELFNSGRLRNDSVYKYIKKYQSEAEYIRMPLDDIQQIQLSRAIKFCKQLGYKVDDYDIFVTDDLRGGFLGLAKNGTIYISQTCFNSGTKMVASTLIEEYIHLKHGYADMTREMQNFLFDAVVTMGERLIGAPL